MNSQLAYVEISEPKGYREWLLAPNLAAVGRLLLAASLLRHSFLTLTGAWSLIQTNWSTSFLLILLFGLGEIGLAIGAAVGYAYARMPYSIYLLCVKNRIGSLGNGALNVAAWYVAEILLDHAGILVMSYFAN